MKLVFTSERQADPMQRRMAFHFYDEKTPARVHAVKLVFVLLYLAVVPVLPLLNMYCLQDC